MKKTIEIPRWRIDFYENFPPQALPALAWVLLAFAIWIKSRPKDKSQ